MDQKNLKATTYEKHPFNNLPEMNDEEYHRLLGDLKENGYDKTFPIKLFEGKILDGWNRYKACKEINIAPAYDAFDGNRRDALYYVWRSNNRRDLTSSQRAAYASEIEHYIAELEAEAKERQREHGNTAPGKPKNTCAENCTSDREQHKTRTKLAEKFNTNRQYIQDAKKIKQEDPETFEKIKSGETNFSQIKKEKKRQELAQKKQEIKQQEKSEISYTPIAYKEDYREYLKTIDKKIDLLLTDPPYSTDIKNITGFVNSWLPLAISALRDTARGYICIGAYPEEIKAYLDWFDGQEQFILDSPLIWTYRNTLGQTPKRKYNLNYQLILHFYTKTSEDLDAAITNEMFSVQNINAPDGRQGDRFHKWQKPNTLAQRLIRHATREGEQVLDPFCGSGTFLVNAGKLNRSAFGCDIDKKSLEIAQERGCDVQW